MSSYETHKGKIKLAVEGEDAVRMFLSKIIDDKENVFDPDYGVYELIWDNGLEKKYSYFNESLYEWVEHTVKYDEEDDFCNLTENADGTISVHAQFYNGGTDISEMIADNLKHMKKYEKKELPAANMKFLIVDWPDNAMVAIFNNDGLGQVANTYKDDLLSELQHVFSTYDVKNAEIEFVDYKYIVDERTRRGLESKLVI